MRPVADRAEYYEAEGGNEYVSVFEGKRIHFVCLGRPSQQRIPHWRMCVTCGELFLSR
jgi:hypothetical protein